MRRSPGAAPGPPSEGPVRVLTTARAGDLAVAKSLLADAGIPCFTRNEVAGSEALFGDALPLELLVDASRAAEALELLAALETGLA